MFKRTVSLQLGLILVIAFINFVGMGLVFPIFSTLFFAEGSSFLPADISYEMRGIYLGILIALMPFVQFFASPIFGAFSDAKGRKRLIEIGLIISVFAYLIGAFGLWIQNIYLVAFSRMLVGVGSSSFAILQASIADLSAATEKPGRYSLLSTASGAGFAFGPFLGGLFPGNFALPFLLTALILVPVLLITLFFFQETLQVKKQIKIHWLSGFKQIKKACTLNGLRTIFVCVFLGIFGWCYFFEFVPVFLITKFQFSQGQLGLFSGLAGAFYALSTGLLIRPLLKRIQSEKLFFYSMIATGIAIISFGFISSPAWVWPAILCIVYVTAPFSPTSSSVISNRTPIHVQGEALGILGSIVAAGYTISPFLGGTSVGKNPESAMWIGGSAMLLGGLLGLILFYRKHFIT